eukprot:scaffold58185_cov62-Phaeocystis_antarctica.AAC.2
MEQLVRVELPCGTVQHFEGEKEALRAVRVELPCGEVLHLEGESGAERLVRHELLCGRVWNTSRARRVRSGWCASSSPTVG